jgi:DNA-binding HxlR family transcriptional regulator
MTDGDQQAYDGCYCPNFHSSIELIGRRWTGAILLAMLAGLHQYTDLRDAIPGLSDRLLTERLKELEAAGVVSRCAETRVISYGLTDKGKALGPILDGLSEWSSEWAKA